MGNQTNHYKNERYKREKFIKEHLGGDGNIVDRFLVNNEHPMGDEIHELRDNGVIVIYNARTNLVVTKIIARPQQIKRYYQDVNKKPPKWLVDLAYHNTTLHYYKI